MGPRLADLLARTSQHCDSVRNIVWTVMVISVPLLFVAGVISAILDRPIIVEAITVPKELSERGYTGDIPARQLIDEIDEDVGNAQAFHKASLLLGLPTRSPTQNLVVPATGISLQAIIYYTRKLFGVPETKITGEVIRAAQEKSGSPSVPSYVLRIRLSDERFYYQAPKPADDFRELVKEVEFPLLEELNPYLAGVAYLRQKEFRKATRMVQLCLRGNSGGDRQSALNLRGAIALGEQRYKEAKEDFSDLLKEFPDFYVARQNLALVNFKLGDYMESFKNAIEAASAEGSSIRQASEFLMAGMALRGLISDNVAYKGDAKLSLALNELSYQAPSRILMTWDPGLLVESVHVDQNYETDVLGLKTGKVPNTQAAIAMFRRAVDANPTSPLGYLQLGFIEHQIGDTQRAKQALERADALFTRRTDIGARSEIHVHLSQIWASENEFPHALEELKTAATFRPREWRIQLLWGQLLLNYSSNTKLAGKVKELRERAVMRFKNAVAIEPENFDIYRGAAKALLDVHLSARAFEIYEQALPLGGNVAARARREIERLKQMPLTGHQ